MWSYEHGVETTATPEAIWALWADVPHWGQWNDDVEQVSLDECAEQHRPTFGQDAA